MDLELNWQANKTFLECCPYMLHSGLAADTVIVAKASNGEQEELLAHRFVLVCYSSVLQKELCGTDCTVNTNGLYKVTTKDISLEALKDVLRFMYHGEITPTDENSVDLLGAADGFKIWKLQERCHDFIFSRLKVGKWSASKRIQIFNQLLENNLEEFADEYLLKMRLKSADLTGTEFIRLSHRALQKIIGSDHVCISAGQTEVAVLRACIEWARERCRVEGQDTADETCRDVLGDCLYRVRLPLLSLQAFAREVTGSHILSNDQKVKVMEHIVSGQDRMGSPSFDNHPRLLDESSSCRLKCELKKSLPGRMPDVTPDRNLDIYDYYYVDDEEDDAETDRVVNGANEKEASSNYKPDEPLPGGYPYGNEVHVEGKSRSTLRYPPQWQGVSGPTAFYAAPTEAQMAAAAIYSPPGQPITGMPGPAYLSSPERPSSLVNARYPPQAGMMVRGTNLSQVAPGQSPARFPFFATPTLMVSQPIWQDSSVSTTQPLSKPQQASPEVNSGASPTQGLGSASSATKFPMAMPNKMGFGNLASDQSPKASPAKHGAAEDGGSEGETEEENTSIEFKPLVSLSVMGVVTGEEQETPLFSERAKLFRLFEKQWKERGLGVMKILHNKETNSARLLMRTDQVQNVCANHKVKPDMTIAYKAPGDDNLLTWRAVDFTDGEPRLEQFSCKFKTADIAAAFKSSFEKAINIVKAAVPETVLASPATQSMKTAQGQVEVPATEPNTVVSSARPEALASSAQKSPVAATTDAGGFSFKPATTAAFGQHSASSMLQSIAAQVGMKNDVSSEAAATEKKPTFGGFTFASKPVFSFTPNDQSGTPKADVSSTTTVPQEQVTAKPYPFASFTFSPPKTAANVSPSANTPVREADKPNGQSRLFGSVTSSSPALFASLSSKATPTMSSKDSSGKAVVPSPEAASPGRAADESGVEEYEPDVDFKPIVTLPEAVDIKTGEEEEEKVFGQKAMLFRMDPESKQWKERGVSELKIMRHKSTNKYRIVMRRDQVLKLCANHYLSKDMKLLPMVSSDKAWCWYAQDFAEEEIKSEQLAAKFKTSDLATMFKEAFEESVQKLSEVEDEAPDVTPEDSTTGPQAEPNAGEGGSLASLFKKKTGDWECNICYVKNNGGAVKCVACETPKPGAETPQSSEVSSTTSVAAGFGSSAFGTTAGFSMNAPSQGFTNVSFGNVSSTTKSTSVYKLTSDEKVTESSTVSSTSGVKGFSMASQPGPGFGSFSFGSTPTTKEQSEVKEVKKTTVSEPRGGFQLQQSSPAPFTFTPTSATKEQPDSTESGQDSSFKFSFSLTPLKDQGKTPIKSPKSAQSPLSPEYYVNKDGDDDHIYFEPVVRLPDQVETKTGEEEEEILFMHRAKLFRFFEGEWKERGLGDVKILRQSDSRKCRILMRREQVHKICLNHNIAETITLKPMPKAEGKACVWHAQDFADGEAKHEQLAIKFKTGDIASEFQKAFNKAKTGEGETITVTPSKVTSSPQKGDAKAKAGDASNKNVFNSFSFASTQKDSADTPHSRSPFTPFGSQDGANRGSVFGGSSQPAETPSGGSSLLESLLAEPVKKTSDQGPLDLSSDIQIAKIEEPSADDVKKAEMFQLPRAFYLFNERPDCKGCLGCLSDEFEFSTIGGKAKVEVPRVKVPETTKVPAVESAASHKPPLEKPDSTTEEESLSMFGTAASSFGDFASIAATSSGGFGFGKSKGESHFQWQGAGASVFRGSPSKAHGDDGDDGREDDDDVKAPPDVSFEPVVQLPEVVDLKTGEEDEEIIFSQRAKLYRFDGGQWKERGIGEMKILTNRSNGRVRLLLRKEQIFKVACNHYLKVDMKLKPLATCETAWIWVANDYAESEAQMQQFAVKFKTKDLSLQFKEVFEHCQEELNKLGSSMDKAGETIQPSEKTQSATAIAQEETDKTKTVAAAQAPETTKVPAVESAASDKPPVEKPDSTTEEESLSMFGTAASSFGDFASIGATSSGGFGFGKSKGESQFQWQGAGASVFRGSPSKAHGDDGDDGREDDDDVKAPPDVTFEPVVQLPEVVDLKTGEEDEEIIFSQRAKLYRFDGGQWKERGIGDMKILKNRSNGRFRLLLRREQIFEVACNHYLQVDMKLKPLATCETAWIWVANDYAESEAQMQQFAVKFKTKDLSLQFKAVFESCQKELKELESSMDKTGESIQPSEKTKTAMALTKEDNDKTVATVPGDGQFQWQGAGTFELRGSPSKAHGDDGDDGREDDDDVEMTFKPVVRLPEVVDLKTGEEYEEIIFSQRAKLYRFDGGQWKERGVGEMKILKNRSNGRFRLLLRREQIFKVALASSETAWIWVANDYAESEAQMQQFAVKFKTKDLSLQFKAVFESCQKELKELESSMDKTGESIQPSEKTKTAMALTKEDNDKTVATVPGDGQFQWQGAGTFELRGSPSKAHGDDGDDGREDDDDVEMTFKPVVRLPEVVDLKTGEEYEEIIFSQRAKLYRFDGGQWKERGVGEMKILKNRSNGRFRLLLRREQIFKVALATSETAWIWVANDYAESEAQMQQFAVKFKTKDLSLQFKAVFESCQKELKELESSMDKTGESIQPSEKTKTAMALTKEDNDKTVATVPGDGQFQWQGAGTFELRGSPSKAHGDDGDDGREDNDDVEMTFKPVVRLPEVVDLKTGEEYEEIIFSQRAKLYRFDGGQWKERGVGEMKILKNRSNGRFRLLLRREQIFKVACNHYLKVDMKLKPLATSETAWIWVANDYAESEAQMQQFAVKFKTKDLSLQFKAVFESCQKELKELESSMDKTGDSIQPSEKTKTAMALTKEDNDKTVATVPDSKKGKLLEESSGEPLISQTPGSVTALEELDEKDKREEGEEDDEDEDGEYEDVDVEEDEEEEEAAPVFAKRATLYAAGADGEFQEVGMGELQVLFDEDVMGSRIRMATDKDIMVCNHVICTGYQLHLDQKRRQVEWKALDFSTDEGVRRVFRVQFSSVKALEEFDHVFQDGTELARQLEIHEVRNTPYSTMPPEGAIANGACKQGPTTTSSSATSHSLCCFSPASGLVTSVTTARPTVIGCTPSSAFVTSTTTAQPLVRGCIPSIGYVTSTTTAQPLVRGYSPSIGSVTSATTAQPLVRGCSASIGSVTSIAADQPFAGFFNEPPGGFFNEPPGGFFGPSSEFVQRTTTPSLFLPSSVNVPSITTAQPPASSFSPSSVHFPRTTTAQPPASSFSPSSAYVPSTTTAQPLASLFSHSSVHVPSITTAQPTVSSFRPSSVHVPSITTAQPPASSFSPSSAYVPSTTTAQPPASLFSPSSVHFPSTTTAQPPVSLFSPSSAYVPSTTTAQPPASLFSPSSVHFPSTTTAQPPVSLFSPSSAYVPSTTTAQPPASLFSPSSVHVPSTTIAQPPVSLFSPSSAYVPSTTTAQPPASLFSPSSVHFPSTTIAQPPVSLFSPSSAYVPSTTTAQPPASLFSPSSAHVPSTTTAQPPASLFSPSSVHVPSTTTASLFSPSSVFVQSTATE